MKIEEEKVSKKKDEVEVIIGELNKERTKANKKSDEISEDKAKIEAEKKIIEEDK